jgi:uncharacterized protein (DUF427 family)
MTAATPMPSRREHSYRSEHIGFGGRSMQERIIRVPDRYHPIVVERSPDRIIVTAGGKVIANTGRALSLQEAGLPSVLYIPRRDVDMNALKRSETARYCPYKGEASYFSIMTEAECTSDCAWTYDMPHWAVCEIEDHVAFAPESGAIEIVNR